MYFFFTAGFAYFGINVSGINSKVEGLASTCGFYLDANTNVLSVNDNSTCPSLRFIDGGNIYFKFIDQFNTSSPFTYRGVDIFRKLNQKSSELLQMFTFNQTRACPGVVLCRYDTEVGEKSLVVSSQTNAAEKFQTSAYIPRVVMFKVISQNTLADSSNMCQHYPDDSVTPCMCYSHESCRFEKFSFIRMFEMIQTIEVITKSVQKYGNLIVLLTDIILIALSSEIHVDGSPLYSYLMSIRTKGLPTDFVDISSDILPFLQGMKLKIANSPCLRRDIESVFVKYCKLFEMELPGQTYTYEELVCTVFNQPILLVSNACHLYSNTYIPKWIDFVAAITNTINERKRKIDEQKNKSSGNKAVKKDMPNVFEEEESS